MKIIDKTGKVYSCASAYPMSDPISGHVYQAGELVKVDENTWIKSQPFMVEHPQANFTDKPAGRKT